MYKILEKASEYFTQQLPFVMFSLPNETTLKAYFQKNNQVCITQNFEELGFVFTSFAQDYKILIPKNNSDFLEENIVDVENFETQKAGSFEPELATKKSFETIVEKAIQAINHNEFTKVVVSRVESIQKKEIDLIKSFQKLLKNYPSAFRYLWYHPSIGLWMGATPELLCAVKNKTLETVSLAGTQLKTAIPNWHDKEVEEQNIVTQYIENELQKIAINVLKTEPKTVVAGNLMHLKTQIIAQLKPTTSLNDIIETLHPTPAVCGFPKNNAQQFILENEGYNRSFYTGFLGEVSEENTAHFFVNLRCLEVEKNTIKIYVGCGITADSNPELEFFETHHKSITLKKIL